MLNLSELNYTIDSLRNNYKRDLISFADNVHQRSTLLNVNKSILPMKSDEVKPDLLALLNTSEKLQILQFASSNVAGTLFSIESTKDEFNMKQIAINDHLGAVYDKFVVAFACLLMFFIGAPLGAIIRRRNWFTNCICSSNFHFLSFHQHFWKEISWRKRDRSIYRVMDGLFNINSVSHIINLQSH